MLEIPVSDEQLERYRQTIHWEVFPKIALASYEHMREEDKKIWLRMRYRALKSHLYLGGYIEKEKTGDPNLPPDVQPIMGMDFQVQPHERLFNQFIQKRPGEGIPLPALNPAIRKRMILWPRNVFKTSSVIVDIVQTILNYPNIRICFLTGGDDLAKRQLARVKSFFENPTPMFKLLFPEFCLISTLNKKTKQWEDVTPDFGNQHEFTVPCRTIRIFAEPTFAITTAKSVKAGSHFDLIYIDDLVNDQNYRSVKALEKCYQDYLNVTPLIDPRTGLIVLTGTRYSFGDTYERIMDLAKEEEQLSGSSIWLFSIEDCWIRGCENCTHPDIDHNFKINVIEAPCIFQDCPCRGYKNNHVKDVLFPHATTYDGRSIGGTVEDMERLKREVGPEFFANQYENNPLAAESQTFTEALLGAQTLHHEVTLPSYLDSFTFAVGDLAYVGQEGRDYSVIFLCRLYQGQIFVYDCRFGNWDSAQIAKQTCEILIYDRPAILYYEKFNGWEAYNNVIEAYAKTLGIVKVPLQWEKGSQAEQAKLTRIGAVKGVLVDHRLWLFTGMGDKHGMSAYTQLVNQLVKWPKLGKHDDFADCLGMVTAAPTGYQLTQTPQAVDSKNWLRKLHGTPPDEDDGNSGSFGGSNSPCGMN
jgi:hypothetical protein